MGRQEIVGPGLIWLFWYKGKACWSDAEITGRAVGVKANYGC